MTVFTVVLAILAFGFLIVAHELGHFFAAKASGVRVNEFWVGMGPAIFKKKIGDTDFKLCILPFGGACVMEGEDEDTDDPHTFLKAKVWKRAIILAAGPFMNFIAGILIVLIIFIPVKQSVAPIIQSLETGFISEGSNGLMAGDKILRVNNYKVLQTSDITLAMNLDKDDRYDFTLLRDGKKVKVSDVYIPMKHFKGDAEGVKRYGMNFTVANLNFTGRFRETVYTSYNYARMVWVSLAQLVSGNVGVSDMSGPVGVTSVLAQTAQSSMRSFFMLVAFISINLGVMNLLPIPALDGGRLVFVFIEMIFRRPVSRKYEAYIHAAGLALLMAFMVFITFHDILTLAV